jgi:hypothetical protein
MAGIKIIGWILNTLSNNMLQLSYHSYHILFGYLFAFFFYGFSTKFD